MLKNIFVHHKPEVFNVGDFLCTPKHYFKFETNEKVVFVGGGVFYTYGLNEVDKYKKQKKIAWGIGSSYDLHDNNILTDEMRSLITKKYCLYGTRDVETLFDGVHFLPCVSVFNSITDIKKGDNIGVFLNFDLGITTKEAYDEISAYCVKNNVIFGTNSLNEIEFKKQFSTMGKIITNSYHVAYWALLSGREIILIGYSSKFRNLLKMFDLDADSLLEYTRNDPNELLNTFYSALEKREFLKLVNPNFYKEKFKKLNIEFAEKLVDLNIINSYTLVSQNRSEEKRRIKRYAVFMKVRGLRKVLYDKLRILRLKINK